MLGIKSVKLLQKNQRLSERKLAKKAGVSRTTLRSVLLSDGNVTVRNIEKVSRALGREPLLALLPPPVQEIASDDSIPVISLLIAQDEKWTGHLSNFIDSFRRTRDPRLVLLPPIKKTKPRMRALLASTVCQLCAELGLETPAWADPVYFLPEPWFPSGVEALKAMAIQESPFFFRRNNIFVLENFLSRA